MYCQWHSSPPSQDTDLHITSHIVTDRQTDRQTDYTMSHSPPSQDTDLQSTDIIQTVTDVEVTIGNFPRSFANTARRQRRLVIFQAEGK